MKQYKFVLAVVITAFLAVPAFALDHETPAAVPVELKLAGRLQNMPLLQLEFSQAGTHPCLVTITDENGLVLYHEKINTAKQFLLNTEDLGNAVLRFDITDLQSRKTVSYRVSPVATVLQQAELEKL
ncbi:MAG: hypothetical protein U0X40_07810 [Ferruginibacter sp.]